MFWASAFVAIRYLGDAFSPGPLSLGRLVVGSVCLGVVALAGGVPRPTRAQWCSIVVIGVLWFGVYNVALNEGEQRVDAGTAAMLIQVSPILIAVLAALFLDEQFTRYLVIGLALAFGGVALIAVSTSPGGDRDVLGVGLCLLAAAVYAVSLVLQKPLVASLRGVHVTWLACSVGMIACLPFAGTLVVGAAGGARRLDLVAGLPRRLPDGDRVHDVRLRAAPHERQQPRRHDLPRPADHDRDGAGVPRRGPARRSRTSEGRSRWSASRSRAAGRRRPTPDEPPVLTRP